MLQGCLERLDYYRNQGAIPDHCWAEITGRLLPYLRERPQASFRRQWQAAVQHLPPLTSAEIEAVEDLMAQPEVKPFDPMTTAVVLSEHLQRLKLREADFSDPLKIVGVKWRQRMLSTVSWLVEESWRYDYRWLDHAIRGDASAISVLEIGPDMRQKLKRLCPGLTTFFVLPIDFPLRAIATGVCD